MSVRRFIRILAGVLVPIALVFAGLNALLGSVVLVAFGVLTACFGAGTYWATGRYAEAVERFIDAEVDFTTRRTFLAGLFQAGLTVVQFVLLSLLAVQFGLVTSADVNGAPPSVLLTVLGVALGGVLGAGVPYLVQRNEFVKRVNDSSTGQIGGQFLTFGSFVALLALHPVVGLWYSLTYMGSRITVLLGFFVGSRI